MQLKRDKRRQFTSCKHSGESITYNKSIKTLENVQLLSRLHLECSNKEKNSQKSYVNSLRFKRAVKCSYSLRDTRIQGTKS